MVANRLTAVCLVCDASLLMLMLLAGMVLTLICSTALWVGDVKPRVEMPKLLFDLIELAAIFPSRHTCGDTIDVSTKFSLV